MLGFVVRLVLMICCVVWLIEGECVGGFGVVCDLLVFV